MIELELEKTLFDNENKAWYKYMDYIKQICPETMDIPEPNHTKTQHSAIRFFLSTICAHRVIAVYYNQWIADLRTPLLHCLSNYMIVPVRHKR